MARARHGRTSRTDRERGARRGGGGRRRGTRSELRSRVLVAIPAIALAVFLVSVGGVVFTVGVVVLGLICLHELFSMYRGVRPVRLAAMLGLAAMAAAAHLAGERQVLLALVASLPVVFLLGLATVRSNRLTASMSITVLGLVWIGLPVAHAVLLRGLPHGDGIVVDVLVGTFVGDTGAYLGGRAFGTRRLAPSVSPTKTVEGLVIGIVAAVIATWAAGLYQDWLGHGQALLLGVAVGLVAPIGDLFESKVKRDAGTKDAGSLFGSHGGALDRLDAALFSLVAGYYVWLAML